MVPWLSSSSMALFLVIGSHTSSFQFQRGLKRGNPLAPILFHSRNGIITTLSFICVIDAGHIYWLLAPKKLEGLGRSKFYRYTRDLLFKWTVVAFSFLATTTFGFVLFSPFTGPYGQGLAAAHPSEWSTIIKERDVLKAQGID
ncbi:hypothetical protein Tco_0873017 [Tanacetum coccineum]